MPRVITLQKAPPLQQGNPHSLKVAGADTSKVCGWGDVRTWFFLDAERFTIHIVLAQRHDLGERGGLHSRYVANTFEKVMKGHTPLPWIPIRCIGGVVGQFDP